MTLVLEEKKKIKGEYLWYDHIPISVNDTYGDPFIAEQVDNIIKISMES